MGSDRQKLKVAVLSAAVTAAITVGFPAVVDAFKPEETVNVVLRDLREKEPEQFDDYVRSELAGSGRAVMTAEGDVTVNGAPVTA